MANFNPAQLEEQVKSGQLWTAAERIRTCKEALQDNPDEPTTLYHLSLAYLEQMQPQHAIEIQKKMAAINHDAPRTKLILALCQQQMHEDAQCEATLRDCLAANLDDPEVLEVLAARCIEDQDIAQAQQHLRKILDSDPNRANARAQLAVTYLMTNDIAAADSELTRAVDSPYPSLEAAEKLALLETHISCDTAEADKIYQKLIDKGQREDVILAMTAGFYTAASALEPTPNTAVPQLPAWLNKAHDILQNAIAKFPDSPVLHCLMARWYATAYQRAGMNLDAAASYVHNAEVYVERTLERDPCYFDARCTAANNRLFHGRMKIDTLEKILTDGIELHPHMSLFYTELARLYLEYREPGRREPDKAEEICRKLLSLDPRCCAGHMLLGRSYRKLGRMEESLASLMHAIELDPTHIEATIETAITQYKTGDLDAAAASLDKARRLNRRGVFKNMIDNYQREIDEQR